MGGKWGQVGHNWGSNRTQYRRQPVTTRLGLPETAISQTMTPKQKAGPPMAAPLPLVAFGLLVEAAPEPIFHTAGE